MNKPRTLTTVGILSALLLAALFVPLPHRVFGTLQVEPQGAENLFVAVPGRLEEVFARPGDRVEAGTPVARLNNPDVHLALAKLETRCTDLRTRLDSLFQLRLSDENAGLEIAEVEKSLAAVQQQLAEKQADLARLNLLAPIAGTVLPPPESPEPPAVEGELTEWYGTPLDRPNLGCYLSTGALVCRIGEPGRLQAALVVDQADIGLVREGQEVELQLDALPHKTLHGTVRKISHVPLESAPRNLSNKVGGPLATKTDSSGAERPLNTSYQVWVDPLDDPDGVLRIGSCGRARVHVAGEPLASRVARWFSQTFYFQL